MNQAISGEVTSMTIWPSIGTYPPGRTIGRLCDSRVGWGFFTLGKVMAAVTIPVSLVFFAWRLLPFVVFGLGPLWIFFFF